MSDENKDNYGAKIWVLALVLVFLALLMIYTLFAFWPSGNDVVHYFGFQLQVSYHGMLLASILMAGGIGAMVATITAFSDEILNYKLDNYGLLWYFMRPFIGMLVAIVFYLVLRGGFFVNDPNEGNINEFAFLAVAALAGMFSTQATNKLKEVFDNIFQVKKRDDRHENQ